ncbi:hypothetical protein NLG97_g4694 [Lecanicillium saksenae]|uniref:Uncharacterized protein n=1 Tax=Lecanicillium saksenae TaxID=468837 RepID=A0ACC1QUJ9_9HYPO|nr:hypothetical protein NLG97_g4694 [Lecanicillium saksenae]
MGNQPDSDERQFEPVQLHLVIERESEKNIPEMAKRGECPISRENPSAGNTASNTHIRFMILQPPAPVAVGIVEHGPPPLRHWQG